MTQVKERPILFSAAMVRAILSGEKTQTRRAIKGAIGTPYCGERVDFGACKYGAPGDRLWVRETFKPIASGVVKNGYGEVRYGYAYQADSSTRWNDRSTIIHDLTSQPSTGPMQFQKTKWKPSIHMPRVASRITLEITGVRIERLNDISEEDAEAEGWPHKSSGGRSASLNEAYPIAWFASLWESINGPGSWELNPWVWVIEFKRV